MIKILRQYLTRLLIYIACRVAPPVTGKEFIKTTNRVLRKKTKNKTKSKNINELDFHQRGRLLHNIKSGFVAQGTTYTQYCREHGISPSNGRMAILGGWCGPKAKKLVDDLCKAAGVRQEAAA